MALTIVLMPTVKTQYPKYLEKEELPLMRSAIIHQLALLQLFAKDTIDLMLEYSGCPTDQVETQAMSQFIVDTIPSTAIMNFKADHGDVSSCFDEAPYEKDEIFPHSTPLKNTPERRLVALAAAYFGYKNYEHKMGLKREEHALMDSNNQEYYDFLGRIPGITIIKSCGAGTDDRVSRMITFGQSDWYLTINPITTLHAEPKKVLRFLQKKGYTKTTQPAPGQIVVYHTRTKTEHFGKIAEIDKDGQIMVISKFGQSHFYKHRIELTQFHYGNSVTFLKNPPQKTLTLSKKK